MFRIQRLFKLVDLRRAMCQNLLTRTKHVQIARESTGARRSLAVRLLPYLRASCTRDPSSRSLSYDRLALRRQSAVLFLSETAEICKRWIVACSTNYKICIAFPYEGAAVFQRCSVSHTGGHSFIAF